MGLLPKLYSVIIIIVKRNCSLGERKKEMSMSKTMNVYEAARALGTTSSYVYALVYSGRIAAEKRGRRWLVDREAVEEWKRRNQRTGLAPSVAVAEAQE